MQVGVIPVTAFQQNCSILHCPKTNKAAVVDPGGELELLRAYIDKEGIEVEQILLTHAHIDHAGATHELMNELHVPVIGPHLADNFLIETLPEQGRMLGLGSARSFVPDRWLVQGDVVFVGEERFDVRHCPGHTPGHVVFYNEARKFVLVGDVLFHGSIGRTDLPRGDHQTLLNSLRDQILTLPDDVTFLPGHGPTSTIGVQRRSNPFLRGL
jgi:hydroxyacylglutathione hydrolase